MSLTLLIAGVALIAVATILLGLVILWAQQPPNDPGPWRLDERLPRTGTLCRYRSVSTENRCTRDADHRGRHDVIDT